MSSFPEQNDPDGFDPKHLSPGRLDPTALHALIDDLSAALHGYVDVAAGIRAEFDAATAQDDPRIEAVEDRIGEINAAFSRRFEDDLGMISGHTAEVWIDFDPDDPDEDEDVVMDGSVYEMGFLVASRADESPEEAFSLIESGGERIVRDLFEAGFDVREWGTSRSDFIDQGDPTDPDGPDGPDDPDTPDGS